MNRTKISLVAGGVFLLFLLLGWLMGSLLAAGGSDAWILRGGLWLLGSVAAGLTYVYLARRYGKAAVPGTVRTAEADIDVALAAAEAKLRAASLPGARRLSKLPVVLVLGPGAGAKTSSVVNSGVEAELLAGEVDRGSGTVPTSTVNLWYSQGTILVEAGGGMLDETPAWTRLIRKLRPSRVAAALARGRQAPRLAVVCFPCDEFLKPGNSEAVPAAAARLRARLAEISQQLGIRLPVYVLFTKADRIPYFEDFVRSLSREEAQEILGATLAAGAASEVGSYAERESARVREAFGSIYNSLALRRLELLPRESQQQVRGGVYEFPREFRKISDLAAAFLVELCRPRQLGIAPFLRGFYFSGVRAIILRDVAGESAAAARPVGPQIALGATSVFNPDLLRTPEPPTQPSAAGGRKVPEWAFLKRVFREVILQDHTAMAITAGGTRVNLLRRTALVTAAALCLLLAGGFTLSFAGNRALERSAFAAARAVEGIGAPAGELAPAEALARLDELRVQTERLRGYESGRRPWKLRWGLYSGDDLLPELRLLYFDRFDRLLWGRTRAQLASSLRGLPDQPADGADYGAIYDLLKGHLITTSHPAESSADFLAPLLLAQWSLGGAPVDEQTELALRQFRFYAAELPHGNPYGHPPEEAAIARTRVLLQQFSNVDQFYQVMISEASRDHESVQFDRLFPGAEAVVRNPYIVPGAFTREGWAAIEATLADVDRLFAREDWVVGERAVSATDRVRLAQELRARYAAEYIDRWRQYLAAATINRGSGMAETSRALDRLSGNESPLLQMLALASRHTDVDTTLVARAFQPVHAVMPPDQSERYIADSNAPYIAALAELRSALDQVGTAAGPMRAAAMGQALSGAERVRTEVRSLAQQFSVEGEARLVGSVVQTLLQTPVTGMDGLLGALPAAEVNQSGVAFCQPFRQLATRYPFNPQATTEATLDEVAEVFQRGTSVLWAFHQDALQDLLVRQGARFAPRVGAPLQPTPQFIDFFNRAVEISETLYDERGGGPEITFLLRAHTSDDLPEVTVNIDGQAQAFTRTFAAARTFTWNGARARDIRISGTVNGRETTLLEARGTWAVFRLFQAADWEALGGDRYLLGWRLAGPQQTLAVELTMAAGSPPLFRRDYLAQLSCASQIVR